MPQRTRISYLSKRYWLLEGCPFGIVVTEQLSYIAWGIIGIIDFSHLVVVFARSHLNVKIRRRYHLAFLVAPLLLFIALIVSYKLLLWAVVLTVVWDLWHFPMQNFGITRRLQVTHITDYRRWQRYGDIFFHLVVYILPLLFFTHIGYHLWLKDFKVY